jgi:hypothetical protein
LKETFTSGDEGRIERAEREKSPDSADWNKKQIDWQSSSLVGR